MSAMKALKPKIAWKYDGIVNAVRTELNVPMNRTTLISIALEGYLKGLKLPKGGYDIKAIAEPVAAIKKAKSIAKLEAKLKAMKAE